MNFIAQPAAGEVHYLVIFQSIFIDDAKHLNFVDGGRNEHWLGF